MLKRLSLVIAALVLPSLLCGRGGVQAATLSTPPPPVTPGAGWAGLPDLDPSSGRFLTVSGDKNFTIPGVQSAVARNVLRFAFDPAALGTQNIRIVVFDPDAAGQWP